MQFKFKQWVIYAFLIACTSALMADKIELDHPVKISVRTTDRARVTGLLVGYDRVGFKYVTKNDVSGVIGWDRFKPKTVFAIHQRIYGKGTGEQWFELGDVLLSMEGGRVLAEKAFSRAQSLEPALGVRISELIDKHDQEAREKKQLETNYSHDADEASALAWPKLTAEQQQQAISEAKSFASSVTKDMDVGLSLYETNYYLLFTDLPAREGRKWGNTLDNMYVRLCNLFALPPAQNIFRGKAMVFVFTKRSDFATFEREHFNFEPGPGVIGLCHQRSNGNVIISFYRLPNKRDFMGVLVHESAHGFVYRYRSGYHLPTWSNEGIAEWVSRKFGPRSQNYVRKHTAATKAMRKTKSMGGDFFTADYISPTQYGIAADVTDYMIRKNPSGYAAYINGIKDGVSWRQSLRENYGLTVDQLVTAYGKSIGVKSLRQ